MNRVFLTKLHLILAAFMFPAVLMFLLTGALYTWGNKGEWHEEIVQVSAPMENADEAALREIALAQLAQRGLPEPSGAASVSGEGSDLALAWTGARTDIKVAATDDPSVAEVTINQASLHRWLVQLHKAKGSVFFKIYATFLAISLFILVLSGLIMGLQVPALRRLTWRRSGAGLAAFIGFVLLG
ncbi:MAG: PepSY domain-containing protein [Alteripontixanthobacter sp.]